MNHDVARPQEMRFAAYLSEARPQLGAVATYQFDDACRFHDCFVCTIAPAADSMIRRCAVGDPYSLTFAA